MNAIIIDALDMHNHRKSLRLRRGCIRRSCHLLASFMFCIITVLVWSSVVSAGEKGENVGRYLCEAFGGRVANVLLNQPGPLASSNDQDWNLTPLQNGKWDAAFEAVGNPCIGFDFSGSALGRDPFDLFPYRAHHLVYQDVFTGFVFDRPFREHELHWGIPGVFDDGFDRVYLQRRIIANWSPKTEEQMKELKEMFVRNAPYPELDGLTRIVRRWLR